MFDIGFTELLLVGIVALVVLGPDRLPALRLQPHQQDLRIRLHRLQVDVPLPRLP